MLDSDVAEDPRRLKTAGVLAVYVAGECKYRRERDEADAGAGAGAGAGHATDTTEVASASTSTALRAVQMMNGKNGLMGIPLRAAGTGMGMGRSGSSGAAGRAVRGAGGEASVSDLRYCRYACRCCTVTFSGFSKKPALALAPELGASAFQCQPSSEPN